MSEFCEAVDIRSGERVLDVAAGNGNASLAAARHWCEVVATDYVGALLDRARARAIAEGRQIEFREADAEALPFADGSFDVVLSTFGVMFAPDQEKAAAELIRVCRQGGRIGLANWTPTALPASCSGPSADMCRRRLDSGHRRFGYEQRINELFNGHGIVAARRCFDFRYKSAAHWLEISKSYFGPTNRAFAALDTARQEVLEADLMELLGRMNRGGMDTLIVPSETLEIVVTKH